MSTFITLSLSGAKAQSATIKYAMIVRRYGSGSGFGSPKFLVSTPSGTVSCNTRNGICPWQLASTNIKLWSASNKTYKMPTCSYKNVYKTYLIKGRSVVVKLHLQF